MSLERFRQAAIVTVVGLCVVVVAGGVVRLTGSGLGCDDWPNCNSERFVDVSSGHTAIEQINRLASVLLGIPTLIMAVGSFRVRPRGRRLVAPSLIVLFSVLANGVVGGIAVRGDLHPALVQSHFLLAMVSITFALIAADRARPAVDNSQDEIASPVGIRVQVWAIGVLTGVALVTGTVVTGTGPHAGDEEARRWGLDISNVAKIHSVSVLVTIGAALILIWSIRRGSGVRRRLSSPLSTWMFIALLQGGIGYLQYFNEIPELLVGTHIAGATALWVATVQLVLATSAHTGAKPTIDEAGEMQVSDLAAGTV
ncbi:MAG: COX15/CtaA family protein, partial [Actinobacteria bacterium]|nr:COX15/CtaA family protein [Actinomycetota bacterium]